MRDQEYYERGYDDAPRRARSQNGKKRKKKRSGSRGERVVVTLLSLLFLTVAAVATVKYVVRAPEPDAGKESVQTEQDGTQDEDTDAIETIANGKERKNTATRSWSTAWTTTPAAATRICSCALTRRARKSTSSACRATR